MMSLLTYSNTLLTYPRLCVRLIDTPTAALRRLPLPHIGVCIDGNLVSPSQGHDNNASGRRARCRRYTQRVTSVVSPAIRVEEN
jgi:hypothetical protein